MRDEGSPLSVWAICAHPSDFPNAFVAREHRSFLGGSIATENVVISTQMEIVRDELRRRGLQPIPPHPEDDPVIVEVWL